MLWNCFHLEKNKTKGYLVNDEAGRLKWLWLLALLLLPLVRKNKSQLIKLFYQRIVLFFKLNSCCLNVTRSTIPKDTISKQENQNELTDDCSQRECNLVAVEDSVKWPLRGREKCWWSSCTYICSIPQECFYNCFELIMALYVHLSNFLKTQSLLEHLCFLFWWC